MWRPMHDSDLSIIQTLLYIKMGNLRLYQIQRSDNDKTTYSFTTAQHRNIIQCSLLHDCPLHLLCRQPISLRASILRSSLPTGDRWAPPRTRQQRDRFDTHSNGCRSRYPSKLSLPLAGLADIERDEIIYERSAEDGVRSEALQRNNATD